MSVDILSDVLRQVRLRGALYFKLNGGSEFAAEVPAAQAIAAAIFPYSDHVMEYHVVLSGSCWCQIPGGPPTRLQAGDIMLFPHGDSHVVSSSPGMRAPVNVERYYAMPAVQLPLGVSVRGIQKEIGQEMDDPCTQVVCGFLGCDLRPFNPLISTLPRLMHIPADPAHAWIISFLLQATEESLQQRAGGEVMLERLSEMMFVNAVRRHLEIMPPETAGWLSGLRDRQVSRALALMHEDPAAPWTVDELGQKIGMSRSALHDRFAAIVGMTPMQYLTNWRVQVASNRLRDSNATIATIAQEVGYSAEAAFTRAFRRVVGMPPAAWRRELRTARTRPDQGEQPA